MTDAVGDLPSGVVTFVFTDIEDSTRLFRSLDQQYRSFLERHLESGHRLTVGSILSESTTTR